MLTRVGQGYARSDACDLGEARVRYIKNTRASFEEFTVDPTPAMSTNAGRGAGIRGGLTPQMHFIMPPPSTFAELAQATFVSHNPLVVETFRLSRQEQSQCELRSIRNDRPPASSELDVPPGDTWNRHAR